MDRIDKAYRYIFAVYAAENLCSFYFHCLLLDCLLLRADQGDEHFYPKPNTFCVHVYSYKCTIPLSYEADCTYL